MKIHCEICGVEVDRRPSAIRKARHHACRKHGRLAQAMTIRDLFEEKKRSVDPYETVKGPLPPRIAIMVEVAAKYRITLSELRAPGRGPRYRWYKKSNRISMYQIRQEAARRLRSELGLSFPVIGRLLGGRHHTTIMTMVNENRRQHRLHTGRERLISRILAETKAAA